MAKICIDLNQSSDAVAFADPANLIQQQALERVQTLIKGILAKIDGFKAALEKGGGNRRRYHDSITVHGARGSGKTTFIVNLFSYVKSKESELSEDVAPLGVIDPTLIESKENILLTIISSIQRHVVDQTRQNSLAASKEHKEWTDRLRTLARGLQLLDCIGPDKAYSDDWADDNWVLEKGLKNARSGGDFEADFHAFINASLSILDKKAFLLAFDDIDTSFERGWPVLETIRKYLTTPQLIVIMCGNLELYAHLVRRRQFEVLGPALLRNDRPHARHHRAEDLLSWRGDKLVNMVGRLEDQYLLKIMKPENRVSLLGLDYYVRVLKGYEISVAPGNMTLEQYVDAALKARLQLTHSIEPIKVFRDVILRQPVRTAIQILLAHRNADGDHKSFLDSLGEIAAAALFHAGLSPEHLRFADGSRLLWLTIQWLEGRGLWGEGYRLVPNHRDEEDNMVTLVLGGQVAEACRTQPELPLVQILQLGLLRELTVTKWSGQKPATREMIRYLDLEHVEKPSTIARRMVAAIRSARGGTAYRSGFFSGTFPISGASMKLDVMAPRLYGGAEKADIRTLPDERVPEPIAEYWRKIKEHIGTGAKPRHEGVTMNTLVSLFEAIGDAQYVAALPASITPDVTTNRQTTFYSIFSLLGVIAELMALPAEERAVREALIRLGQTRTYPLPHWVEGGMGGDRAPGDTEDTDEADETGEADDTEGKDFSQLDRLVKALCAWIKRVHQAKEAGDICYHPHVFSRIGTRFYYTLQRVDAEGRGTPYTGSLIHRQIISFLNAVLVEERLARGDKAFGTELDKTPPELTNPTTDDFRFIRSIPKLKYRNISDKSTDESSPPYAKKEEGAGWYVYNNDILVSEASPLFHMYLSCPIFGFFVSPKSRMKAGSATVVWNLLEYMQGTWGVDEPELVTETKFTMNRRGKSDPFTFPNLYALLNSVPVLQQDQD